MMQSSFGPIALCLVHFLQLLAMVVEVGVDLGMVVVGVEWSGVEGRRVAGLLLAGSPSSIGGVGGGDGGVE
jgi:hypothetical protein